MTLSVVIPAYNEERTIGKILERVFALDIAPWRKEIIVVDDGSTDGTADILKNFTEGISVYTHEQNKGKGAAVRTGFSHVTGDYVVVQDADLEYDPRDLKRMLALAERGNLPAVYGSRRLPMPGEPLSRGAWHYYLGGVGITWFANLLYGIRITDEPTCYKMLRQDVLRQLLPIQSNGFEFCPEITAKLARLGAPIIELPIHYHPRSSAEGKKIRIKDGFIALWTLLKYRFWRP